MNECHLYEEACEQYKKGLKLSIEAGSHTVAMLLSRLASSQMALEYHHLALDNVSEAIKLFRAATNDEHRLLTEAEGLKLVLESKLLTQGAEGKGKAATYDRDQDRYSLTKIRMPFIYKVANSCEKTFEPLVLIGLPLTFETLCLIEAMRLFCTNIAVIPQSSGPDSSLQPGVFHYLSEWGIPFFREANSKTRQEALALKPKVIVDCSFMIGELGFNKNLINPGTVIIEDTKTGENRLNALIDEDKQNVFSISYSILDHSNYKRDYENQIGIGYSVVAALMSLGIFLPQYKVGVIGFGPVGSGTAAALKRNGASVYIAEIDFDRKALARNYYPVLDKKNLIATVDIIITATGRSRVITKSDFLTLNKRIMLVNAGGEEEWERKVIFKGLEATKIGDHITRYDISKCEVWEFASGNSVNLAVKIAVSEFLDLTFSYLIYCLSRLDLTGLEPGFFDINSFNNENFKRLVNTRIEALGVFNFATENETHEGFVAATPAREAASIDPFSPLNRSILTNISKMLQSEYGDLDTKPNFEISRIGDDLIQTLTIRLTEVTSHLTNVEDFNSNSVEIAKAIEVLLQDSGYGLEKYSYKKGKLTLQYMPSGVGNLGKSLFTLFRSRKWIAQKEIFEHKNTYTCSIQ